MNHTVGRGAVAGEEVVQREWFALFGLFPLGEIDSQELADGAEDYTITTEWTVVDMLINVFTFIVTIQSRTITVTK